MNMAGIFQVCMHRGNVCSSMLLTDYPPGAFYLIQGCFSASLTLQHSLLQSESLMTCLLLLLLLLTHPCLQLPQILTLLPVLPFKNFYLFTLRYHILIECNSPVKINQMETDDLNKSSPVCAAPAALCVPAGDTSPVLSYCFAE